MQFLSKVSFALSQSLKYHTLDLKLHSIHSYKPFHTQGIQTMFLSTQKTMKSSKQALHSSIPQVKIFTPQERSYGHSNRSNKKNWSFRALELFWNNLLRTVLVFLPTRLDFIELLMTKRSHDIRTIFIRNRTRNNIKPN